MSSIAARTAVLDFNDLEAEQPPYEGFQIYKRSKLAQTIFAFELDRRLRRSQSTVESLVAHPGGALDALTPTRSIMPEIKVGAVVRGMLKAPFVQGKDTAAWPAVRALLDPHARGGQLWGPRFLRLKGHPTLERPAPRMLDEHVASQLWAASESATSAKWEFMNQP